jgi:hypothetical protein
VFRIEPPTLQIPRMTRDGPVPLRLAFGIAAVAMTAFTFGVLVVLPAEIEQDSSALVTHASVRKAST